MTDPDHVHDASRIVDRVGHAEVANPDLTWAARARNFPVRARTKNGAKGKDMHDGGKRALILVDFINLFDFEHSEKLAARALEAAKRTAKLEERMKAEGVPCIYANDNFGHWRSEFSALVRECLAKGGASGEIARLLQPDRDDYSVLKPRHSAFYETPLEFLLQELEVDSLVITGLSTDMCVSATAQDGYVRKYKLWVPADCVAADTAEHERQALELMERTLKADIRPSTEVTEVR